MHQHNAMCNNFYAPLPYHQHHGHNMCSPYEMIHPLPAPVVHNFARQHYHDHPCRQNVPRFDYSYCDYVPRRPVIQTNVHNDVCYYLDDPYDEYDDEYEDSYRLSRSRVQLVDIVPKHRPRRNSNRMVVSTFQPRQRQTSERIIIPRSNVVRRNRNPSYERHRQNMKLMPFNRSVEPQYRRRSIAREMVPVVTVENSYPQRQSIRIRTLSPF
ncbi:unnamed protein product [Rotaria magnacalcarata]|uniref:Uncharacterized protein n=2 Tax=Rotaria magnacalcarata TaxID=392030 RepID=A0A816N0V2_9BILA|nr:unnamed protein product [Rotaria magnacalcarata]